MANTTSRGIIQIHKLTLRGQQACILHGRQVSIRSVQHNVFATTNQGCCAQVLGETLVQLGVESVFDQCLIAEARRIQGVSKTKADIPVCWLVKKSFLAKDL
jgi:hypothetical protein